MPSLQIARALVGRGHAAVTIELFGSRRGQEAALWPTLEFSDCCGRRSARWPRSCDAVPGWSSLWVATPAFRRGWLRCWQGPPWYWSIPMRCQEPSMPSSDDSPR